MTSVYLSLISRSESRRDCESAIISQSFDGRYLISDNTSLSGSLCLSDNYRDAEEGVIGVTAIDPV